VKISCLFILLFALLPAAPAAAALPTISCHCFQDRSFEASRPAAADPYLLATTQNSLMAAVFDLDKKSVVRERMAGTPGETLWVAHYLADRCGLPASDLRKAHDKSGSWSTAAAASCAQDVLGVRFATLLEADGPEQAWAAAVVDEVVIARLGADPEAVEQIRLRGGSNAELVLAVYLARNGARSPAEIHADIMAGLATWGQLLERGGGKAAMIEQDIRQLVKLNNGLL
jgi:hypothetical protein